jgi:ABC-2 type transport system permease protein
MSAAAAPGISGEDERAGLGRPIKGPSALGSSPSRLWHLTWTLARTEFKLTFVGSVLGYLWHLMRPLLLFGVIYVVLTSSGALKGSWDKVLTGSGKENYFAAALLLGIVLFTYFSEASGGAVTSLVNRETLVRKIEFPRLAVPLSIAFTALLNLALNLIPVLIFLLAEGGRPRWSWLELPLLVVGLALFSVGLGMVLSVGFVRYRDVQPIWEVALQATFYAAGIFIVIANPREPLRIDILGQNINLSHVLMANPFAAILEQARHAFISAEFPTASEAMGGGALILIPIGIALAALVVGFLVFDRQAPYVAEQL